MMPIYSGSPQGGFGQQYGAGTYDPMLGFGQASGMGTTYNYPTRYSADYSRYAQSGQQFNQPVMGYNSFGQIFAQPQRPPPSFGKGGGGPRRPPPPTMGGGKGGNYRPNPVMPSVGFDPEGYFRNRPVRGPRGDQGSRGTYGGFLDFYNRQNNNPDNYILKPPPVGTVVGPYTGPVGQVAVGPTQPPNVGSYTGGLGNNVPEPGPQGLPSPLVPIQKPLDQERILPGQDIANSPFAGLIGNGLGGMVAGRSQDPNLRVMGERNFGDFNLRPTADQFIDRPVAQPAVQPVDFSGVDFSRNFSSDLFGGLGGRFGAMQFQEGGQVPPDAASNMDMMLSEAGPANPQSEMAGEYDRLIQMTMQAVLGQTENADEIIQMFIDEFGADAFRQLRDAVLKQQVPGAQTEGMVDGNGGGMDDQVMGMIGNQRPVAVSPGEYIVPADVVSGLGDGSSKSGADILDELNQAVRMARTGTTEQPRPLAESMR
jgi:hypothetical protein